MKNTDLASGLVAILLACAFASAGQSIADENATNDVYADHTVVSFDGLGEKAGSEDGRPISRLVLLPPDAGRIHLEILEGSAEASVASSSSVLRGLRAAEIQVEVTGDEPVRIAVHHEGTWIDPLQDRLLGHSRAVAAAAGLPIKGLQSGSYVIVCAPAYAAAADRLAAWKMRKGLDTAVVTTNETGTANTAIKAWLQNAYDTWDVPPEYVLLLGDVEDIPAWSISQNLTDQPYAFLDGEDWLPDLLLGRMPVANELQADAVVTKTINYERYPYVADPGWFTRSLMVGANYPARTPVGTVQWCGQQLQSMGFDAATEVLFDPFDPDNPDVQVWDGVDDITACLNNGASIVVYRGWAQGIHGWETPKFLSQHVAGVNNGGMMPIMLSFVCHTGDFADDETGFGEHWLRQSLNEAQGAVAFFGNTEAWSHTRYNDAIAIGFFERISDEDITDLGSWILAGKLRFMDYFPSELDAGEHDEESVEFYFDIYNLLGDPELALWKTAPETMVVVAETSLPPGATSMNVLVNQDGARISLVQNGVLLGSTNAAETGAAVLSFDPVQTGSPVFLTITSPDCLPHEAELAVGDGAEAYLSRAAVVVDDGLAAPSVGNGDGQLNPGETISVSPDLLNSGQATATGITANLSCHGPGTIDVGAATWVDIAPGASTPPDAPFAFTIADDAEDGALLQCFLNAEHATSGGDHSVIALNVSAPTFAVSYIAVNDDGILDQGLDNTLSLTLSNTGSAATTGGSAVLTLLTSDVGNVVVSDTDFGPLAADGGLAVADSDLSVHIDDDVASATGVSFALDITTDEGYVQRTTFALSAGRLDIGAPTGPNDYGYYAYDSADIDYPTQVPAFSWTELSTEFGGAGTELVYTIDYDHVLLQLPAEMNFSYYGTRAEFLRVSMSGWVSPDTNASIDAYNWPIPSTHGNASIIAPFWDNFVRTPADADRPLPDGVYWQWDDAAGELTIEWSRMSHYQNPVDDLQTFQLVLRDADDHVTPTGDSEILFLYRQVLNSDNLRMYATCGIESPDEEDGLQLSYSNLQAVGAAAPSSGLAVLITTAAPVYSPYALSRISVEPGIIGTAIAWEPIDDRPVTGWMISRIDDSGLETVLTEAPLAATTRSFIDSDPPSAAECTWMLVALHPAGQQSRLGPYEKTSAGPTLFYLAPAQPNPAPGSTHLAFSLPRSGTARLRVFDVAGRLVRTLHDGGASEGRNVVIWDGCNNAGHSVSGGVYFCRLEAGARSMTQKILLVR